MLDFKNACAIKNIIALLIQLSKTELNYSFPIKDKYHQTMIPACYIRIRKVDQKIKI